uniref:TAZ-type domain-containing protein n=1 Tax=Peronospora matthiolae TaxID=2874970 RepID=A0AAV1UAY0_9STRA
MPDVRLKHERVEPASPSERNAEHESSTASEAAVPHDAQSRSNRLLVHACNCDNVQCEDPEFWSLCGHMKRFLRAACWASHNEQWRSYPIATVVIELFTYHALHCQSTQCNVPMCRRLRG